ncbi:MAG TPA: choice-of-anchor D domain-containing protein [Solirubrobacterales bacterium]|nr:choice-of-anchor D domain-containing protein [Solirubrobacterales bacterium]
MLFTFLAVIAVRPAAGLAAPEGEPPAAEEPRPPQLAFEPGGYDFGLQPVNNGPNQANFELRNTGSEEVHVDSVEISPSGDGSFWTNSMCPGRTLQPNETCWVQVYFGPRNATEYAVQLRANAGPYSFRADLTGTGGRAILSPAFNPTDFGVAAVGSAGVTHEIAVTNTGNMPGGAFIAVISGGAVGSFQLLDENCTGHLLAPAATCTLQVRFRPLSEGVKTAMLGLFGESDGGTQIVLTGVGSAPQSVGSTPPPAIGAVETSTAPGPAARPRSKFHTRKPRIPRRHRRVSLDASRVLTRAR